MYFDTCVIISYFSFFYIIVILAATSCCGKRIDTDFSDIELILQIQNLIIMLVFSLLFIMYHYFVFANSNSCTDDCNANFPDGVSINFCGTDGISYSTTHDAIDGYASNYCYLLDCNIAALYQGKC